MTVDNRVGSDNMVIMLTNTNFLNFTSNSDAGYGQPPVGG